MKIDKTKSDKINFGFNYNTHRKIAQKLINNEFPKLQKYSPIIKKSVVDPDFDELGFKSNSHFYYQCKNYLKPRESFLDIDGAHNAYTRYNIHVNNFLQALKVADFPFMAEEIGRAKHFLDDMCVGFHVKRGNFLQKWKEKPLHTDFENFIYKNEDRLIANASPSEAKLKSDNFEDLFISVVEQSSNNIIPDKNNLFKWPQIAQDSINLAIDSSRLFFSKISDLIK